MESPRPALLLPALAALLGAAGPAVAQAPASIQDELRPLSEFLRQGAERLHDQGFLVVFQEVPRTGPHAGDSDIGAQRLGADRGEALWGAAEQPVPVSASEYLERDPAAITDGSGGAFVVFEAEVPSGDWAGDVDIFAQHLDSRGRLAWFGGERSLVVAGSEWSERAPTIAADGSGGFYAVFELAARSGEHAGDIDVGAARVSPEGQLRWHEGNQILGVGTGDILEQHPVAVPDGQGGLIVVFEGVERGGERGGMGAILAQRVSPDGRLLWNGGSRSSTVSISRWDERAPVAVSDGAGGAIVVFEQRAVTGPYAGDIDLAAQRLSAAGQPSWNDGQAIGLAEAEQLERAPAVVPDGHGGAIVVYEFEARSGERVGNVDILAQHLAPDGRSTWNGGNPVAVASSPWSEQAPVAVPDGHGGAIVVFEQHAPPGEYAGDIDLGAQRVDATGALAWFGGRHSADVASSDYLERRPRAVSDGQGGVVVVFEGEARTGENAGDVEVLAQHLLADGTAAWSEGQRPALVAVSVLSERKPVVVAPR